MQALGNIWGDTDPLARGEDGVLTCLEEPVHFGAKLLLSDWEAKREAGGFRVGRDLPSRALSTVLRNLVVCEPIDGGQDYRARVAGSALMRRFHRDITGMTMSQLLAPEDYIWQRDAIAEMFKTNRPFGLEVAPKKARVNTLHYETWCLPVIAESGAAWVLAGIFYHDWVG